jgi:hypothetical protein
MILVEVRSISVKVHNRASMDHGLNETHERMIEAALQERSHGIMVTRHTDGQFTFNLSQGVPFGHTEEEYCQNCMGAACG